MQGWGIVITAILYLLFLFVVASYGDRTRKRSSSDRSRPAIYALSLAVYCTSWTFFGSVGLASASGLDYLAIYLGPILMVTVGFPIFNHIINVAKSERITSIADFIASRYGKSTAVGALAAVIAVLGTVPYIALQLKAISNSVDTMVSQYQPLGLVSGAPIDTAFFVSILLALFAVLFGTRHADATEHQSGLMLAVATESIVKLIAFLAVGLFATFYLFDGIGDLAVQAQQSAYVEKTFKAGINPPTFAIFTVLSFCAFILLPRQFHVGVVENHSVQEVRTARWMFPLYLVLINLFVVPVAIAGMLQFGQSIEPDSYVLALPIGNDARSLALLVFVGGLSAATAMVIVACVALAIMLSNNIVLPLVLRQRHMRSKPNRDMAPVLLNIRRWSIFGILVLAYAYFQAAGDTAALASIGLLSFAAIAQFAPSFFGGLFWRGANGRGALWGMSAGFAMWFYTLFLPTLLDPTAVLLTQGPLGIDWLRPQQLFGFEAAPLTHGVLISLLVNCVTLVTFSKSRDSRAVERMQANAFWFYGGRTSGGMVTDGQPITVAELREKVADYLGDERCERAFSLYAQNNNRTIGPRELADDGLMHFAEQLLASAIGAASSRLVMSLMLQKHARSAESTLQLLDDASEALQENRGMLQTAIDQVEQGISVFDTEFRLSSWNRRFRDLLDLPIELGQAGTPLAQISEAIAERCKWDEDGTTDFAKRLLELDRPWQVTRRSTGQVIEVYTKPLPGGGHVISWHDMTEQTNAARALQEANETLERRVAERTEELTRLNDDLAQAREAAEAANIGKTKFLAAVGHDILQPLNAARLYASSLVEKLDDDPAQKLATNVDDSLESVEDILGAVLTISRMDSGALTPSVTSFSIASVFRRLETEFSPIAAEKGLQFDVATSDFAVRSDFSLLLRLLQNLVSNAIKYTETGGVQLDAHLQKNRLVIEVSDSGRGIDKKDEEAAYLEFRRLEGGRSMASGLGLGLSIVKRLSEILDHPISMESKLGSGTTFAITVPIAVGVVGEDQDRRQRTTADRNRIALRIICLDNEPRILDGMKELLSGWGCTVFCYEESRAMAAALSVDQPDVLIADYHLNNETGIEAIGQVRGRLGLDFPAILITADRSAAVRRTAESADVTLLNKPVKPAALRAILTRHVQAASEIEAAE